MSKRRSSWVVVGVLAVLAVVVLVTTRSCQNTTDGLGEDIEDLGDKVEDATD